MTRPRDFDEQHIADTDRIIRTLGIDADGDFYAVNARVTVLLIERIEALEREVERLQSGRLPR